MGTEFRFVIYTSDAQMAAQAASAAFKKVAELDATMSDYRETSELMRLCHQPAGQWVKISLELFEVLTRAKEFARLSGGAFDLTVGNLVRLWRRARRNSELPDPKRLRQALDLTGYEKLQLDRKTRSARLERPGMLLDLGGIAKGYAADQAMQVLKAHHIKSALVAAGGDIVVSQPPLGTSGWTISIATPASSDASALPPLNLRDAAVSTSGDAQQYVEIDGVRYSHIVDPRTGLGVTGRSSVTVVAPNGTTSDALATAASVLGPEQALKLIDRMKDTAAFIVQEKENDFLSFQSKHWHRIQKANQHRQASMKQTPAIALEANP